jgi:hypothetical protein
MWLLLLSALAADPSAWTDGNVVRGTVTVPVPAATIRGHMTDPLWLPKLDESNTEVTVREQDGACLILDCVSPSTLLTVRYTVRRCPTTEGYKATLIESNAFSSCTAEWRITDEGEGARMSYALDAVTSLPVPQSWARGGMKKAIGKLMKRLDAWGTTAATSK